MNWVVHNSNIISDTWNPGSRWILSSFFFLIFFFSLFCFIYLIWRNSLEFKDLEITFKNTVWFLLSISISTYFLIRSHPNNLFNILPFLTFCIIQIKNKNEIKKTFLFYFDVFLKNHILFHLQPKYSYLCQTCLAAQVVKRAKYLEQKLNSYNLVDKLLKTNSEFSSKQGGFGINQHMNST